MRPHLASRLPIRWRLTVGAALSAALVLAAIDVAAYRRTENHLVGVLDDGLREEAGEMAPLVGGGDPVADLAPLIHEDEAGSELLLQAFDGDGNLVGATPAAREATLLPDGPGAVTGEPVFTEVGGQGRVRLLGLNAVIAGEPYVLVSAMPYTATAATLSDLSRRLLTLSLIGVGLTAMLAYGLAASALRPVERMRRRAAEIRSSEPGLRLPLPTAHDEIRRLGETLNHTLDELEDAAARRRLVVAHASHELRTPLTRLRTTLELAGRRQRTEGELRAAIEEAAVDTEELIALVNGLLDLGAIESGPSQQTGSPTDVAPLVQSVTDPVAGVEASITGRPWVSCDPPALERAVANLVTNAQVHGCPPVSIEVDADDSLVSIVVWDHGAGIAPDLQPVAFEPFTRAADAAARPGSGLGLAIVAAVTQKYGGTCSMTQRDGCFGVRIELPAVRPPTARDLSRPEAAATADVPHPG